MAHRKKHAAHEEEASEAWLVPYADILTLLLALFIVLFATSSGADASKYNAVMEALYIAFNGDDIPDMAGLGGEEDIGMGPGDFDFSQLMNTSPSSNPGETEKPATGSSLSDELDAIKGAIEDYISDTGLGDLLTVRRSGLKVYVTLGKDAWFTSGRADILPQTAKVAQDVAEIIRNNQYDSDPWDVVIEGHTDNVPQKGAIKNNWMLSSLRALNFLDAMGVGDHPNDSGFDPAHFSAMGMGEWDPIASNDTAEGRQANRRVEISITKIQDTSAAAEEPAD
ncbi:motility protein B [Clostridia bacterium]|nr:motility protein B [Clostridia bacterium]